MMMTATATMTTRNKELRVIVVKYRIQMEIVNHYLKICINSLAIT